MYASNLRLHLFGLDRFANLCSCILLCWLTSWFSNICVFKAMSKTYIYWFGGQVRIHDIKRACGGSAAERHLHPTIGECSLPHVWTINPPWNMQRLITEVAYLAWGLPCSVNNAKIGSSWDYKAEAQHGIKGKLAETSKLWPGFPTQQPWEC